MRVFLPEERRILLAVQFSRGLRLCGISLSLLVGELMMPQESLRSVMESEVLPHGDVSSFQQRLQKPTHRCAYHRYSCPATTRLQLCTLGCGVRLGINLIARCRVSFYITLGMLTRRMMLMLFRQMERWKHALCQPCRCLVQYLPVVLGRQRTVSCTAVL